MVNIQVYNEENKKIETVRCEENETMRNVQKLEDKYGETQVEKIEKDTSKKTPMIRYYLSTETHRIIVSMTIFQAERVNDYLASYEAFAKVYNETETENEGDENVEKYLGVKILKNGTEEEIIIEAEDWDDALLIMGSICAFDDKVDDYTCDLATEEDVARVQANELSEEERTALEERLKILRMSLYNWKRAYFGVTPKPSKSPYDDEISEIKRKLGEL